MLWNSECPVGLSQKRNVRISMKEIWHNLDGPPKKFKLWSYVVSFEFSRLKVAKIGSNRC